MKLERPKSKRPLPDDAQEVFHGERFSVYQWEQELFDGSIKIFEKLKRHGDSVIILAKTEQGKYLITHEEQPSREPFIGVPAGEIDQGEEPFVAAQRELMEETGYEAAEWQFWFAEQPSGSIDWAEYYFVAKGCVKVRELSLDPGERIEVELVDFESLKSLLVTPKNRLKGLKNKLLEALVFEEKMTELKKILDEI